jgi:hypothetical protein
MNSESDVKREIKKLLKQFGIWYFMPQAGKFGTSGIPDFVCCTPKGRFLSIEAKFGYNKPSDLQQSRMEDIRAKGGIAIWVNENRLLQLEALLERLV